MSEESKKSSAEIYQLFIFRLKNKVRGRKKKESSRQKKKKKFETE